MSAWAEDVVGCTLHSLGPFSERLCGGNYFPQIAAPPESWDDGAPWEDSQVLRVLVEDALQLLQALLDVRPPGIPPANQGKFST